MGAAADTIWRVPAYLPYLQPPLTEEAVAAAERELGYKLPGDYVELLKRQNGGYIRYSLPDNVHDSIAGIGPNFPSLTEFDWSPFQEDVSFPLQGLVPFDGDGHWHLCLDYRRDADLPSVTYVDVECDRQSSIASSFAEYLALLRIDVGNEYVLEAALDIAAVVAALASALAIAFDPPDTWAHGYPTYRGRLGTKEHSQWIWLSPNVVPRGFVRSDDSRYAQLKDLMPGQAARFPGLPEPSYILSAADDVSSQVIDACVRAQFVVRPLREYMNDV